MAMSGLDAGVTLQTYSSGNLKNIYNYDRCYEMMPLWC